METEKNLSVNAMQKEREVQRILREFKEALARRLWALPNISEAEKELVFKEYLGDLNQLERDMTAFYREVMAIQDAAKEENELLRNLMGVEDEDVRGRNLNLGHEVSSLKKSLDQVREERDSLTRKFNESDEENQYLRKRIQDSEDREKQTHLKHLKSRENDIKYYSEANEELKNKLKDLEFRIKGLRETFNKTNEKLVYEKQEEIALLQKTFLDDLETALKQKQDIVWTEEALFAKGVAQRVRNALVSAQGQLFLTLERLGLLDPETKNEASWMSRLKLLTEGGHELRKNFQHIQRQFHDVTQTLDDYLQLTGLRSLKRDQIDFNALVQKEMAEVYVDRQPTLSLVFHADDPLPFVPGDAELLGFCVRALLRNALEALPDRSGRIEIMLKNRGDIDKVMFIVRDSGPGIPDYLKPQLFQPFLTTKEGHQGLGLARARRYVELHGGELAYVHSNEKGATFQVTLPLKEKEKES